MEMSLLCYFQRKRQASPPIRDAGSRMLDQIRCLLQPAHGMPGLTGTLSLPSAGEFPRTLRGRRTRGRRTYLASKRNSWSLWLWRIREDEANTARQRGDALRHTVSDRVSMWRRHYFQRKREYMSPKEQSIFTGRSRRDGKGDCLTPHPSLFVASHVAFQAMRDKPEGRPGLTGTLAASGSPSIL